MIRIDEIRAFYLCNLHKAVNIKPSTGVVSVLDASKMSFDHTQISIKTRVEHTTVNYK